MTIFYLEALAAIAISLSILMAGAWLVQQRTGNSGWVDTIWTFSLGLVGAGSALWPVAGVAAQCTAMAGRGTGRDLVAAAGSHIAIRTAGITDDPRYAAFARSGAPIRRAECSSFCRTRRLDRSRWCLRSLSRRGFRRTCCGCRIISARLILLTGIAGEALADAQLKRFRSDPANKGRVCDVGLWRWSRHPNYFFEWFGWLAYPVIALSIAIRFLSLGLGDAAGAGLHVLDPGLCHRHPAAGSADAALARRPLPRLSVAYQSRSSRCHRKHDPEKWRPSREIMPK